MRPVKKIYHFLSVFICLLIIANSDLFAQNTPVYVPSDGLVGWWPFTGNANDSSGKGNNGIVYSASLTTDRFNRANSAYEFRPSFGSRIEIPFSTSINKIQGSITISAWIYMDGGTGAGNQPRVLEMRGIGYGGNAGYYIITQNNSNSPRAFEMALYSDSGKKRIEIAPSSTVTTYTWHHIVFVADGANGTASFYVDGNLVNSVVNQSKISSCNFGSQSLFIGSETNIQGKWGGKIDDVGVWSKSFSGCEVNALFSNQKSTPRPLNLGADTIRFCEVDSVKLRANGGFKSYSWSNGGKGQETFAKNSGVYTLMGIDSNNCRSFDTVVVSIINPAVNNFKTTVCYNDSINLVAYNKGSTGSFPISYQWNETISGNTFKASILKDTVLRLKLTNGVGFCYDTLAISCSRPFIDVAKDTLLLTDCKRDSLSLNAGSTWKSVNWSNGYKDSIAWFKNQGYYNVIVTDAFACQAADSFYFVNPGLPVASIVLNDSAGCYGSATGRLVSYSEGGYKPYTKLWNNTQSGDTAINLNVGKSTFILTDAYGCADTLEAFVGGPPRIIVSKDILDSASCFDFNDASCQLSVSGGTGTVKYQWLHDASLNSLSLNNLKAGIYSLAVEDDFGCRDTASVELGQPAPLRISIAEIDTPSCSGSSNGRLKVQVNGGNGLYDYLWSVNSGFTNPEISGLKAGAYIVYVKDFKACQDSLLINLPEPSVLKALIIQIDSVSCFSDSDGVVIGAAQGGKAPYSYFWNQTNLTSELRGVGKGKYLLNVVDASGCRDSITAEVFEMDRVIYFDILADRLVKQGDTVDCSSTLPAGRFSYQWRPSDLFGSDSNSSTADFVISSDAQIELEVSNKGRCTSKDTAFIRIEQSGGLFIPNTFTPNNDGKNDNFGFNAEFEIEYFTIFDGFGSMVFKGSSENPNWDGKIKGKAVPTGAYLYIFKVKRKSDGAAFEEKGMVQVLR